MDLDGLAGKTALVIVSDGKDMGFAPIGAASAIKATYGDALCIYPIIVGDDADGMKLMDQMAQAGGCGFTVSADKLLYGQRMTDFVEILFVGELIDSDGDGVPDHQDAFPYNADEYQDTDGDGEGNNADTDDDNDGMPDQWEMRHGLNPRDASDSATDLNGDGYTNIEDFINGLDPSAPARKWKAPKTYQDLWSSDPDLRARLDRK